MDLTDKQIKFVILYAWLRELRQSARLLGSSETDASPWGHRFLKDANLKPVYDELAKLAGYESHRGIVRRIASYDELERLSTPVTPDEIGEQTPIEIIRQMAYRTTPGQEKMRLDALKYLNEKDLERKGQEKSTVELGEDKIRELFFGFYRMVRNELGWTPEQMHRWIDDHEALLRDFESSDNIMTTDQSQIEKVLNVSIEEG